MDKQLSQALHSCVCMYVHLSVCEREEGEERGMNP